MEILCNCIVVYVNYCVWIGYVMENSKELNEQKKITEQKKQKNNLRWPKERKKVKKEQAYNVTQH